MTPDDIWCAVYQRRLHWRHHEHILRFSKADRAARLFRYWLKGGCPVTKAEAHEAIANNVTLIRCMVRARPIAAKNGTLVYIGTDDGPLGDCCWGPDERAFAAEHGGAKLRAWQRSPAKWVSTSAKRRRGAH